MKHREPFRTALLASGGLKLLLLEAVILFTFDSMKTTLAIALCILLLGCAPRERKTIDLKASVNHNLGGLNITNNDDFSYKNTEIELNEKYKMRGLTIPAKETISVPFSDLVDEAGSRFHIGVMQPHRVVVYCETIHDKKGLYVKSFD